MKRIYLLILLIPIIQFCRAQTKVPKWGKITPSEIDLTLVEYDSSASAVVLYDYGKIDAEIGEGVFFKRNVRLKILKESGKEHADIVIPFYHKNGIERIDTYAAQTINVSNNKPQTKRVEKKNFFKVKVNENWSELRFTFPEVQVGSILEYTYTVKSKNYETLEKWEFQNELPTLNSQVKVLIGNDLNYKIMYQGQRLIAKYQGKAGNDWKLENLPAISAEPYCPNPFDFTEKIKFQLAGYLTSNGYREFMRNWKDMTGDFYDQGGLKQYINKNKDGFRTLEAIISEEDSDEEKIRKIYGFVTKNFEWNGRYRLFPKNSYKEFKDNKNVNSAEINLYLINLLQRAGFDALPALLSTKQHGYVAKDIPFFTQFNHLIANVKVKDQYLQLDATDQYRPYHLLDAEDLNFDALVLHKKEPYWVKITPDKSCRGVKMVNMDMPEPGLVQYKIEVNAKGYKAAKMRRRIANTPTIKEYFSNSFVKENIEFQISEIETRDIENIYKPVYLKADIITSSICAENGDFIYLNPFVDRFSESNPFKDPIRYLPIDFYYPSDERYIYNFKVPEGYEVLEFPESVNLATPNNKGILKINSRLSNDQLQMTVQFTIKEPFFMPQEYPALREIYDRLIEKREEQIVLKKID